MPDDHVIGSSDFTLEVDCRDILGEGPLYDDRTGLLWWVDIMGSLLHRYDPVTGDHQTMRQPTALTSIAKREVGGFVATSLEGFVFLDETGVVHETFGVQEPGVPGNRFNDGKTDPFGRFWAGTMDNDLKAETGTLYCLDRGAVHTRDKGYIVTNGPAFGSEGAVMYHTDTTRGLIYRLDVAPDGQLSNKKLIIEIPADEGWPDGMTFDTDGTLWVCHYFGGRITRFKPDGTRIDHIEVPASCVTSCTFGGPDLGTLYITTADDPSLAGKADKRPHDGCLLSLKTGARGMPSPSYKG